LGLLSTGFACFIRNRNCSNSQGLRPLLTSAYYYLKPFLPWKVRLMLRRLRASRRRSAYSDVWPIDERAGATPPGWPGWPDNKRFGFVLTHDVEGTRGLERVESL